MTIVTGLRKGVVSEPKPLLVDAAARRRAHVRSVAGADGLDARRRRSRWSPASARSGGASDAIAGSSRSTTRRRTIRTSACRSSRSEPVAVEFEPPEKIRPGQMGLLLDERADTLDVTATIIDLAVRGYLTITEIPKTGWFGSTDWEIERKKPADGQLLDYERIVLEGLFVPARRRNGCPRSRTSSTRTSTKAKSALYADAVGRSWFPRNPSSIRAIFLVLGIFLIIVGVFTVIGLGARFGAGMLGLPVIARRAPAGDLVRHDAAPHGHRPRADAPIARLREVHEDRGDRAAGVRRARQHLHELPAVRDRLSLRRQVGARVQGHRRPGRDRRRGTSARRRFNAGTFSSSLGSFSSSVSSTLASTPGGSGSSGFSGGSSGGGGGGGGGGGW